MRHILIYYIFSIFRLSLGLRIPNKCTKKYQSSLYVVNERDKRLVQNADCLFLFPTLAVPVEEVGNLRKALPSTIKESTIPRNDFIEYVDNSGFCQIVDFLSSNSFCIFAQNEKESEEILEPFIAWARKLTPSKSYNPEKTGFLICKKTHMIKLDLK